MNIKEAILHRRSIRRFVNTPVSDEQMNALVDYARLYASGGNLQPIRFRCITEEKMRDQVFSVLRWAAYLPGFQIKPENRPMAYLILSCASSRKNCQFDLGAAATTFMLAAEDEGLGTCCLGAFDHKAIAEVLNLPDDVEPLLVIAVGYPAQESKAVDFRDDVKYYEGEDGVLCVPKLSLEQVME